MTHVMTIVETISRHDALPPRSIDRMHVETARHGDGNDARGTISIDRIERRTI